MTYFELRNSILSCSFVVLNVLSDMFDIDLLVFVWIKLEFLCICSTCFTVRLTPVCQWAFDVVTSNLLKNYLGIPSFLAQQQVNMCWTCQTDQRILCLSWPGYDVRFDPIMNHIKGNVDTNVLIVSCILSLSFLQWPWVDLLQPN